MEEILRWEERTVGSNKQEKGKQRGESGKIEWCKQQAKGGKGDRTRNSRKN